MVTTPTRQEFESAEYRQRMVANLLAAASVTFLMLSGYWVVITLAG
jgi:hypothetical protein